ncbi:MAG: agmatine deiminase family protein [Flavobacteriales bacterium]
MKFHFAVLTLLFLAKHSCAQNIVYTMPAEHTMHEGTWLQWPHNHLYGPWYIEDLEPTFLQMTEALIVGEKVHIILYDENELDYITALFDDENIPTTNIDFYLHENNDCWVRDNGPIFVFDEEENLTTLDWGFNGWGGEHPYQLCDPIPALIAADIEVPVVDLSAVVLEGGAVEVDGNGTFLATKSSIINDDRNPNLTQGQIENYLTENLGVTNFIWLEGVEGLEVTDMHIDGFARFHEGNTIVTMSDDDLAYWEVPSDDITTLFTATNVDGEGFNFVLLPLTQNNVVTTWNESVQFRGSYVNYYIGNTVVLVPTYNDPMDAVAMDIIQDIFPTRTVVGVDCRNLFYGGGMVHCVTQQQPFSAGFNTVFESEDGSDKQIQIFPNPCESFMQLQGAVPNSEYEIFDTTGRLIVRSNLYNTAIDVRLLESGCYLLKNGNSVSSFIKL